jgi:putative oxidoreductase
MKLDELYAKLDPWAPHVLSILRIVAGLLFLQHGVQKLFDFPPNPDTDSPPLLSLMGLAGLIELIGGGLVTVGLFTRVSALVLSGEMAFAYFMAHAPQGFMPIDNGGDLAVLFCFVFLYLVFAGPGLWSVDAIIMKADMPRTRQA